MELISRQVAISELQKEINKGIPPFNDVCGSIRAGVKLARNIIEDLPYVQSKIIRCKDCKYCEHWYADKGRCFLWHEGGIDVFEDGFCNYAESKNQ